MPKRQAEQLAAAEERRTGEEYVIQQQMKFEEQLREVPRSGCPMR
jgi:hypothetical protein